MIFRNARFLGSDRLLDVEVGSDGRVSLIGPAGSSTKAEVRDLDGRLLIPGLWDEHVHFTQWTIQQSRLDLSQTRSAVDVLSLVGREIKGPDRLTGYGFRDGTWPDAPSLTALDEVTGTVPVVLISGDLHCAWMNSAAASRYGGNPDSYGLVRESEWFVAARRLMDDSPLTAEQFRATAQSAARRGVVGLVDFENSDNLAEWPQRVAEGVDSLRVEASVWPQRLEAAIAAGRRTGDGLEPSGLITMGRLKVVVDGSLNTRTALCWDPYQDGGHGVATFTPDQLRVLLVRSAAHGIRAAVHAIGDRANAEVIDIFEELGQSGTIEHAQLVSSGDFARFAQLGLIASVQPEHAMDDRDVADRHWAGRTDRAFAYGSLHEAGTQLRFGSDAPVAPLDPWFAIAAATSRSRDGREPWHPEQRVPLEVALASSMRGRLEVRTGDVADLAVLDADPYSVTPAELRQLPVAATLIAGRFTHDTL